MVNFIPQLRYRQEKSPRSALNWRLGRPHCWSGHFAEKILPPAKNIVLDHPAHSLIAMSTMLSWLQLFFLRPCRKRDHLHLYPVHHHTIILPVKDKIHLDEKAQVTQESISQSGGKNKVLPDVDFSLPLFPSSSFLHL